MKTIPTGFIALSLLLGIFVLAPASMQAQAGPLNIALTVTYQDPNPKQPPATKPNVTPSDTKTVKLTTANIVALTKSAFGPYASGSYLSYDPDLTGGTAAVGMLDSAGDFTDLSSALGITTDFSGNGALTSSSTQDTSDPVAQSIVFTSVWNITFDDGNGNSFNVSGIVETTESLAALTAAQNTNGDPQTETYSYSGTVTGFGTYGSNPAVFKGAISGTGKGPAGS
jgi:hypothetical protein